MIWGYHYFLETPNCNWGANGVFFVVKSQPLLLPKNLAFAGISAQSALLIASFHAVFTGKTCRKDVPTKNQRKETQPFIFFNFNFAEDLLRFLSF